MKPKKRKSNPPNSIKEKSTRYAQLQFSTDPETKTLILKQITELRERSNKTIEEDEILFSKSDIAIAAIKIGLRELYEESQPKKRSTTHHNT